MVTIAVAVFTGQEPGEDQRCVSPAIETSSVPPGTVKVRGEAARSVHRRASF